MTKDLYRALQQRLDKYSMGFPPTESGIEIKILKSLFSEEDVRLFLALSQQLEYPEAVAARLGLGVEETAAKLEDMAERGLLFRLRKDGRPRYGAIAFVHGVFEFQLKNLKPELAAMMDQYAEEAFDKAMQEGADHFLRPIPVHRSIDVRRNVASHDDAVEILRTKPSIVIADCICRKKSQVQHKGCGKPMEACFMFGAMGQYYLDRGMGREIGFEEAVKILDDCREAGLVTQPATAQNPGGMCNCCGDCCGVLVSLNKHPKPATMVWSNHFASIDAELCTGCETCLERCQMAAIAMDDDGLARVNLDRCIGCGLCVTTCPTEAIELVDKPEEQRRVPPVTTMDQMAGMARKRGLM